MCKTVRNSRQPQKAYMMLQSRKVASVKIVKDSKNIFVKGMIKKSYGQRIGPAVVLFQDRNLQNIYCTCPIGTSWLCCHISALLLFLKHYCVTGEKILELTCSQQLQKWHRRTRKGINSNDFSQRQIKVKSARIKRGNKAIVISPADPSESYKKGDVSQIVNELVQKLQKEKPFEDHIHSVVVYSEIERNSLLGQHLIYKYNYHAACALIAHQYCKTELYGSAMVDFPAIKENNIEMQGSFENNLVKSRNDQTQSLTEPLVERIIALPSEKL